MRPTRSSPLIPSLSVAVVLAVASCGQADYGIDIQPAQPDTHTIDRSGPDLPAGDLARADKALDLPLTDLAKEQDVADLATDQQLADQQPPDMQHDGVADGLVLPAALVLVAGGITTTGPAGAAAPSNVVLVKGGFEAGVAMCNSAAAICLMGSVVP